MALNELFNEKAAQGFDTERLENEAVKIARIVDEARYAASSGLINGDGALMNGHIARDADMIIASKAGADANEQKKQKERDALWREILNQLQADAAYHNDMADLLAKEIQTLRDEADALDTFASQANDILTNAKNGAAVDFENVRGLLKQRGVELDGSESELELLEELQRQKEAAETQAQSKRELANEKEAQMHEHRRQAKEAEQKADVIKRGIEAGKSDQEIEQEIKELNTADENVALAQADPENDELDGLAKHNDSKVADRTAAMEESNSSSAALSYLNLG